MAGLDPAIHVFAAAVKEGVDARVKPGDDEEGGVAFPASASCDHDNLSWRPPLHFLHRII